MASTGEAWRLGRRPGLDGLRGVAVLLVAISHTVGFGAEQLGQIGVSMFFTLSGFLIATKLCEEQDRTGRIDFRGFYLRRARRLAPALLACIAVTGLMGLLAGAVFSTPLEVGAALLYVTNWLSIAAGPSGALSHTWSLAIEEQFYLLWPVLFAVLARRRRARLWLLAAAGGGFLVSFAARLAVEHDGLARAALGSDTRAGEVLGGVLLALVLHRAPALVDTSRLATVGLALIAAVAALPFLPMIVFGTLVLPVATALVIVACVGSRDPGGLRWAPLTYLGRRSYGFYLWHHAPAMILAGVAMPPLVRFGVLMMVGLALAEMSWRCIESPFLGPRRRQTAVPVESTQPVPGARQLTPDTRRRNSKDATDLIEVPNEEHMSPTCVGVMVDE